MIVSRTSRFSLFAILFILILFPVFLCPAVLTISPTYNALNSVRNTSISVTFDDNIYPPTINANTFIIQGLQTGLRTGTYSYESGTMTATFTPDSGFLVGEVVSATLTTGIESASGSPIAQSFAWSFLVEAEGGDGNFATAASYSAGANSTTVFTADFKSDGNLDIATSNIEQGRLSVLGRKAKEREL